MLGNVEFTDRGVIRYQGSSREIIYPMGKYIDVIHEQKIVVGPRGRVDWVVVGGASFIDPEPDEIGLIERWRQRG